MTATTEILPIATSGGAYVETQATFAADAAVQNNGLPAGILTKEKLNKVLRQSSFMAAGLANFLVGRGISVPDDGNLAALVANIESAITIRSYISGLTLSNNGTNPNTQIDFAPGIAADNDSSHMMALSASTTKTLQSSGAFAAGTGNNGLFTGARANGTWYHCFLIRKASDGSIDCGFDTSVTAANIPAGYADYRRIGSIKTDGSGNIAAFQQHGDEFSWVTPLADVSATGVANGTANYAVNIPPGVVVDAVVQGSALSSAGAGLYHINSPGLNDVAGNLYPTGVSPATSAMASFGRVRVKSNASQQIQFNTSLASTSVWLSAYGWVDSRGKNN